MRGYLEARNSLTEQLTNLAVLGYGENHEQVIVAKSNLRQAEARIRQYGDQVRVLRAATGVDFAAATPNAPIQKSAEQLRGDLANLTELFDKEYAEMVTCGIDLKKYEDLNAQAAADRDELSALNHRMDVLQTEDSLGGRLSINSTGEIPLSPERDRRAQFAALGAMGGSVLPGGLDCPDGIHQQSKIPVLRGNRSACESQSPTVGRGAGVEWRWPKSEADAAQSIHQIRVTLRSQMPRDGVYTYLVTSALPGEGKTSLTMSLGAFAGGRAAANTRHRLRPGRLSDHAISTRPGNSRTARRLSRA